MIKRSRLFTLFIVLSVATVLCLEVVIASDDPAVQRTRKQIEMLDTLYKTAIVVITDKYVTDPSKFSGASAAKVLFTTMEENGWHKVRLVGLTDTLINPSVNKPKDAFEEEAKKKLTSSEATHEEVVTIDGKRYLRKATPVPVVLEKCAMCHANFKDNDGIIGTLSYTVPLVK